MRVRAALRAAAGAAVVAVLAASCSSDGNEVSMDNSHRFEPGTLTISVGEQVSWVNAGSEAHTVTAYEDGLPEGADYWASGGAPSEEAAREDLAQGLMKEGQSFEVTLDEPGTYRYFCIPHEDDDMKGTIVVEG
ncbi:MAG TPA: plastocyanin/azurin family copper-binding protein [Actinomycetota bacterium]|nr:plastocyanin/azurin family copper-binding protein [Actinomycetota bacterium]